MCTSFDELDVPPTALCCMTDATSEFVPGLIYPPKHFHQKRKRLGHKQTQMAQNEILPDGQSVSTGNPTPWIDAVGLDGQHGYPDHLKVFFT
jgi:hypothetical protein